MRWSQHIWSSRVIMCMQWTNRGRERTGYSGNRRLYRDVEFYPKSSGKQLRNCKRVSVLLLCCQEWGDWAREWRHHGVIIHHHVIIRLEDQVFSFENVEFTVSNTFKIHMKMSNRQWGYTCLGCLRWIYTVGWQYLKQGHWIGLRREYRVKKNRGFSLSLEELHLLKTW